MTFDDARARGIEAPPRHALAAALEETRAACADVRLTPIQAADLIAIREKWNADRRERREPPLSLEDALTKILATVAGLIGAK